MIATKALRCTSYGLDCSLLLRVLQNFDRFVAEGHVFGGADGGDDEEAEDDDDEDDEDDGDANGVEGLPSIRRITKLDMYSVDEMSDAFSSAASAGVLSRSVFAAVFSGLIRDAGGDAEGARDVVDALFNIFDTDGNGVVDMKELASGLSVLCAGHRDDKAQAAFALFDENGDGFISVEEMSRYMTSVFKVLYETQPETAQAIGVGPEELAAVTTEQCFDEADLNHDGRLSFEEFKRWYSKSGGMF